MQTCLGLKPPTSSFCFQKSKTILNRLHNQFSGDCGGQVVRIDVEKEGSHDRSLRNAVSQTSKAALLAVTVIKSETLILKKLHDHSDHVLKGKNPQQLVDKTKVSDSVICRYQVDKYSTGFLFGLERILDVLR